jgi:hypothetical protein
VFRKDVVVKDVIPVREGFRASYPKNIVFVQLIGDDKTHIINHVLHEWVKWLSTQKGLINTVSTVSVVVRLYVLLLKIGGGN